MNNNNIGTFDDVVLDFKTKQEILEYKLYNEPINIRRLIIESALLLENSNAHLQNVEELNNKIINSEIIIYLFINKVKSFELKLKKERGKLKRLHRRHNALFNKR